jgi:twinkle protein
MSDLIMSVSDAELDHYKDAINPTRHVKCISEFMSDVMARRFVGVDEEKGDVMPFEKAGAIYFNPGEITIWAGINGHGKSAITTQIAGYWALQDKPSLIASFEMLPHRTIDRMMLQVSGQPNPTDQVGWEFFRLMQKRIWIYDKREVVEVEMLYRVIRFAVVEKGIKHVWIDSLMKCIRGEDDYSKQKDFVEQLTALAKELMIHIHIVHHVRKANDEREIPNKFSLKGSGAITDLADNVLILWRNKRKEFDRQQGEAVDEGIPDFLLICDKNRHGAWEGRIPLWGSVASWHFRGSVQEPYTRGYF